MSISKSCTITCGKNLDEAMFLTEEFEILCKQITIGKINGKPQLVEKKHMKKIIEAIKCMVNTNPSFSQEDLKSFKDISFKPL